MLVYFSCNISLLMFLCSSAATKATCDWYSSYSDLLNNNYLRICTHGIHLTRVKVDDVRDQFWNCSLYGRLSDTWCYTNKERTKCSTVTSQPTVNLLDVFRSHIYPNNYGWGDLVQILDSVQTLLMVFLWLLWGYIEIFWWKLWNSLNFQNLSNFLYTLMSND